MLTTLPKVLLTMSFAATFALSACSKDESKSEPKPGATEERPETAPAKDSEAEDIAKPKETTPPASDHFAADIMSSYEACRALLAADKGEGMTTCAEGIVAAAKVALKAAPKDTHSHIESLIEAASGLATTKSDDMEALRASFGRVSESTVGMLVAAPETGKNYHVFECPMVKGYQRWAQPNATLENPYMGTRMLACGSEVHDHLNPAEAPDKAAP